ncbi:MAG: PH domain-containing protein [Mycobacteriaceae bacterium]|nr:PH domain-containing protein [Mycobacteriaceae bacterium]
MPPSPPSHTSGGGGNGQPPRPHVIRVTRLSLLAVFMLAFGVLFPVSGWPAGLWWLAALPLLALAWVLRTQTSIDSAGLRLRSLLRSRTVPWEQVKGVRFPNRGFARAVLADDAEVVLPAVTFDRLPELAAHSGGRINDPFTARKDDTDDADG